MNFRYLMRAGLAAFLFIAAGGMSGTAFAQQPSPGQMAAARDFLEAKGGTQMFDRIVLSTVDRTKEFFLQTNTSLVKDLNEVTAQLRTEFAAKRGEVVDLFARSMAQRFTEQELKEAAAFYKSPLGQKLTQNEAPAFEEGMGRVRSWAEDFAEIVAKRMREEMKKRGHTI